MTPSLETSNPRALNLLSEAVQEVKAYRQDPAHVKRLQVASAKIRSALREDPDYLRAVYYDAIVDDLTGKAADALPKYERILTVGQDDSKFFHEVRYNLGVAYYHRYSWSWLDKAIKEFETVLSKTKDPSLELLTRSARAQAYAMHMIPPLPADIDLEALVTRSRLCKVDTTVVLGPKRRFLDLVRWQRPDPSARNGARWAANNASGMRRMYLADYWAQLPPGQQEERSVRELLDRALEDLRKAEAMRPDDWANWCDMGSACMRLGAVERDPAKANVLFDKAVKQLTRVVEELRPNYGFALYELGRVNRLRGNFPDALAFLNRAVAIAEKDRDVGDRRVNLELERAKASLKEYP